MKSSEIVNLFLEAFPDETLKSGQRLSKRKVEILNQAIVAAKAVVAEKEGAK